MPCIFRAAVSFCSTTSEAPAHRSQIPTQKRQPILAQMSQLMPAQQSKRTNPSPQLRGPSSQVPARRCQLKGSNQVPMQNSQLAPTHRPHATGPSLESSRPNSSLLRCPSSQIPAHTSSRVPTQRTQPRNPGIQPLRCWGASISYGSGSSHSVAAELTRAMGDHEFTRIRAAAPGGHGMVGAALRRCGHCC